MFALPDVNECQLDQTLCDPIGVCRNLINMGYTCDCPLGYWKEVGEGTIQCIDVDECLAEDSCSSHEVCTNIPGSFNCVCDEGFSRQQSNGQCEDVDECSDGSHNCFQDPHMQCVNSQGSFDCGK